VEWELPRISFYGRRETIVNAKINHSTHMLGLASRLHGQLTDGSGYSKKASHWIPSLRTSASIPAIPARSDVLHEPWGLRNATMGKSQIRAWHMASDYDKTTIKGNEHR
jgi:hypothetical protein